MNPAICGGTGSIPFTTNLANGTYTLGFSKNGNATTANVTVSSEAFTLTNLTAGVYAEFSVVVSGCTAVNNDEVELENPGCPVETAQSGVWSLASTWNNHFVPDATSNATILSGHVVTLDGNGAFASLSNHGTLLGIGTLTSDFTNETDGIISPGQSTGLLSVERPQWAVCLTSALIMCPPMVI